ncbi:MAG: GNAT family N-acetyltransferase [Patescibacteria group bacterium]|jgi:ribosomal protein S18 acetylase RimI-like enzyme
MTIKIRPIELIDHDGVMKVVKSLNPGWFDDYAISNEIPLDLKLHHGFAAENDGKIVGFITFSSEEGDIKITWLGVNLNSHRKGVGGQLLEKVEKAARNLEVKKITVETLSDKEDWEPYNRTRAFYLKNGFKFLSDRKITNKSDETFWLVKYIKELND